jgi:deoxyribodipyrimidine photo-lyase
MSSPGTTAVVLFTRDLRVHDNPTLRTAATQADRVLPLFVLDETILRSSHNSPNRAAFLVGALRDLDRSLKELGSHGLVVRRGDVAQETRSVADEVDAAVVHVSEDWSGYAQSRQRRLAEALGEERLRLHPETVPVVAPGRLRPSGGDHYAVFGAFWRQWDRARKRARLDPPTGLRSPELRKGAIPSAADVCPGLPAPDLPEPGERAGRRRLADWTADTVLHYDDRHDALAADDTSHLSAYLHFGCLSPLDAGVQAGRSAGAEAFRRQLGWRDFHLQVLAARPDAARQDYRSRGDRWHHGEQDLAAWREGRTGYPIVDAAMRQLLREGWMHNRGRLIAASFLTKHLYHDWRAGAAHFLAHLVDGDVANNQLNWQWVAGTGTDARPNRMLNPLRQAERFDPGGDYVRRYVDELRGIAGPAVHRPWELPEDVRAALDYPPPLVDLAEARARFLAARGR